jgi:hypothetical protein
LRAILRASAFGKVRILIPMLAHAFEIDQSLAMVAQAKAELRERSSFDDDVDVGAMIEIPAAALALPMFVKRMDFLSIGTNDLIQYTLAIDRVDYEVAHLYNPLHPAVLQLISMTIAAGHKAGIDVGVRRNGGRCQIDTPAAAGHGIARILDASGPTALGQAGNPEQRPCAHHAANPQDHALDGTQRNCRRGRTIAVDVAEVAEPILAVPP